MASISSFSELLKAARKNNTAIIYFYQHPVTGLYVVGSHNGKSMSNIVRIGYCSSVVTIADLGYRFIHLSI